MNNGKHLTPLRFLKMHGLGNDFVVIDARDAPDPVDAALARALGDRHRGIGFDQLAVIRKAQGAAAEVDYWNSDGSTADACGNATRCVAQLLLAEAGTDELVLRTGRGDLVCQDAGNGLVRVNMLHPQLDWREIPLAEACDIDALPIDGAPGAAGMGNPHCVFLVPDVAKVSLEKIGPVIEHHRLFPQRTNVEFCQILDRRNVRMRVWERGGMITLACGSGACAAAVVLNRQGHVERSVNIHLDGGLLNIDWRADGVWMTGPTALVFEGTLPTQFLASI